MENTRELIERATARLVTAEHLLTITYPNVQNPRLFLPVLEHLFLSMNYAMNALLAHNDLLTDDLLEKRNFSRRFDAFRMKVAKTSGFSDDEAAILYGMRKLLIAHQQSPTSFVRDSSLVICSATYAITKLDEITMKRHLSEARRFLEEAKLAIAKQPLSTSDYSSP